MCPNARARTVRTSDAPPRALRALALVQQELRKGNAKAVFSALKCATRGRFGDASELISNEKLLATLLSNGVSMQTLVRWLRAVRWPDRERAADVIERLWMDGPDGAAACAPRDHVWIARTQKTGPPTFLLRPPHSVLLQGLEALRAPIAPPPRLGESLQRVRADRADLTEFVDVEGLAEAERQVAAMLADAGLDARSKRRAAYLGEFCELVRKHYDLKQTLTLVNGAKVDVLALVSHYETKYNMEGRLYSRNTATVSHDENGSEKRRTIDVTGMPRALRPFLLQRFAHDLDQSNSQAVILLQMAEKYTPNVAVPELRAYNADRKSLFDHVCATYGFDHLDAEARKELVKPLVLRLMFSGTLTGWQITNGLDPRKAPPCPRIARLEAELLALRAAIFAHPEWRGWVDRDRVRQTQVQQRRPEHKRKGIEDIERSIFARIAQSEENVILTAMRAYLADAGFCALALVYDGIVVLDDDRPVDLQAMSARIRADTGYEMTILEKPMFTGTDEWPTLSLDA